MVVIDELVSQHMDRANILRTQSFEFPSPPEPQYTCGHVAGGLWSQSLGPQMTACGDDR